MPSVRSLLSAAVLFLAAVAAASAERPPIRSYTSADGLPSPSIQHIVQDSVGFIWFSTRGGLSRFDGNRFVSYTTRDGLPSITINAVLVARRGLYWIATNGGGVCRFEPRARVSSHIWTADDRGVRLASLCIVYRVGDEPLSNRVNALYEDRAGTIWAGTDAGVFTLQVSRGATQFSRVPLHFPSRSDRDIGVHGFVEDSEGSIWVSTSHGLFRRHADGRVVHYSLRPHADGGDPVTGLVLDKQGSLWVAHRTGGVGRFVRDTRSSAPAPILARSAAAPLLESSAVGADIRWLTAADGLPEGYITALAESRDGRIWIGAQTGIAVMVPGEPVRRFTAAEGFEQDNTVAAITEDRSGNLWIGTTSSGALKISARGLTTYDKVDGLGDQRVHAIFEDQAGELVVVSGDWVINRLTGGKRFVAVKPRLPRELSHAWSSPLAFTDRSSQWWMLTTDGLYRFRRPSSVDQLATDAAASVYTSRTGLTGDTITALFEDSRGDLWIGTGGYGGGGVTRRDRATGAFVRFPNIPEQSARNYALNAASAFAEDRAGAIWIGFYNGALLKYSNGTFAPALHLDTLPRGMISALFLDHRGWLWIGTQEGGVRQIDEPNAPSPRIKYYSVPDGLSTDNVRCMTEDRLGRMYFGTARGVDVLDPDTGRMAHYASTDGLASDFVTAAFRDRQGALWFGTLKGLSRLDPPLDRPSVPPAVLISDIRIAGEPYRLSELGEPTVAGLMLPASRTPIEIAFMAVAAENSVRYRYRLEGAQRDWSELTTGQQAVTYARLAAGHYRFVVEAATVGAGHTSTPAIVSFVVLPPIWQRWWFVALACAFLASAAVVFHRHRLAQVRELERVRTRIAADLHDDIGSSLSQIAILGEVARTSNGAHRDTDSYLDRISRLSRESIDAMSDIVWSVDPRKDRFGNLVQRIRGFANEVLAARDVDVQFNISGRIDAPMAANVRREVFLIFKEIVNNVRHGSCTAVVIDLQIEGTQLVLRVSDNGKGFDATAPHNGLGLHSLQERASRAGGALTVASQRGLGTTVTLVVPWRS